MFVCFISLFVFLSLSFPLKRILIQLEQWAVFTQQHSGTKEREQDLYVENIVNVFGFENWYSFPSPLYSQEVGCLWPHIHIQQPIRDNSKNKTYPIYPISNTSKKCNISNISYIYPMYPPPPPWWWSNDCTFHNILTFDIIETSISFYRPVLGLKILVILGPTAWKIFKSNKIKSIYDKPGPVYGAQINESILRKINLHKVWISYWPT